MSRLLDKPLKAFAIYALVILSCSIPFYFMVVDFIWLEELDTHNYMTKELIGQKLQEVETAELKNVIRIWNRIQPGCNISPEPAPGNGGDSIYTVTRKLQDIEGHEELERYRGLSSHIMVDGRYYHLTIEKNVEEADETIVAIAKVTGVFFILLVLGFMLISRWISKGIWKPFQNTLIKLQSFDLATEKNIEFETTAIEEFAELNKTLEKLINRNISVYIQQKNFIENASHELQTPLAILKSKVDLLLQNKELTQEQSMILNNINLPLSRVSRINKNLLLLAKIENSQFADTDILNVPVFLKDGIELLSDYISDKNISAVLKVEYPVLLACNKFLLEILVNNLLTNAIRHSPEKGDITIEVHERSLIFCNSGDQALIPDNLFKRFSISSSKTTNSGLGLAIVKEICNRYQWKITYAYNGQHCFLINF